jgi:hypothetical protein
MGLGNTGVVGLHLCVIFEGSDSVAIRPMRRSQYLQTPAMRSTSLGRSYMGKTSNAMMIE